MVVLLSDVSLWSKPCRNSMGSARAMDTEMPFPDAMGFSRSIGVARLVVDRAEAVEAVRRSSSRCGLCTIPLTGPPIDGACEAPSSIPPATEGISASEGGTVDAVDSLCDLWWSTCSCVFPWSKFVARATKRRNRFALSLVLASFPMAKYLWVDLWQRVAAQRESVERLRVMRRM